MNKWLLAALVAICMIPSDLALSQVGYTDSGGHLIPGVTPEKPPILVPVGYCQLTVGASAVQTSTCSGYPLNATYAVVTNEGAAVRWRDDGVAPTASVGNPLGSGSATSPSSMSIGTTLQTLQWISQGGTATLNFAFYR